MDRTSQIESVAIQRMIERVRSGDSIATAANYNRTHKQAQPLEQVHLPKRLTPSWQTRPVGANLTAPTATSTTSEMTVGSHNHVECHPRCLKPSSSKSESLNHRAIKRSVLSCMAASRYCWGLKGSKDWSRVDISLRQDAGRHIQTERCLAFRPFHRFVPDRNVRWHPINLDGTAEVHDLNPASIGMVAAPTSA